MHGYFYSIAKQQKDGWYEVEGTISTTKTHIINDILFLKGIKIEHHQNIEISEEVFNLIKKYV
jgi:hypothetical protein